ATGFGGAPDIGQTVAVPVAHKIDITITTPHRPGVEAIKVSQLRELLSRDVLDPDVGRICTAIILAPVHLSFRVVSEAIAIRRVTRGVAHIRSSAPGHAAVDADDVEDSHEIFAPLTAEQNTFAIG